jgi:capsule polysaccharide export protein KpsE/RkpR
MAKETPGERKRRRSKRKKERIIYYAKLLFFIVAVLILFWCLFAFIFESKMIKDRRNKDQDSENLLLPQKTFSGKHNSEVFVQGI